LEERSDKVRFFSIGIEGQDLGLKETFLKRVMDTKPEGFSIEERQAGNLLFINYILDNPFDCGPWEHIKAMLQQCIADIVCDFILKDMQLVMIEKIIHEEYFYFEKEDRNQISQGVLSMVLHGRGKKSQLAEKAQNWRARVRERILDYLDTNSELIIEGFVRFRLKDFTKELEGVIDRAVDDLLVEKEYNEFIKLLRYFVEIQEPKVQEVHVLMEDDKKYVLLDDRLKIINNDILEELAREISDREISYDDLLISSLITIAPSKITIHECDKIKNTELLNTISKVFRGKVVMSHEGIYPQP
jgi:putative sporulation protein YtxC